MKNCQKATRRTTRRATRRATTKDYQKSYYHEGLPEELPQRTTRRATTKDYQKSYHKGLPEKLTEESYQKYYQMHYNYHLLQLSAYNFFSTNQQSFPKIQVTFLYASEYVHSYTFFDKYKVLLGLSLVAYQHKTIGLNIYTIDVHNINRFR